MSDKKDSGQPNYFVWALGIVVLIFAYVSHSDEQTQLKFLNAIIELKES
jgi:hypothetical protein